MQRHIFEVRIELPQDGDGRMQVMRVLSGLRQLRNKLDQKDRLLPLAITQGDSIVATAGVRTVDD
jgi:hypothetical protein